MEEKSTKETSPSHGKFNKINLILKYQIKLLIIPNTFSKYHSDIILTGTTALD